MRVEVMRKRQREGICLLIAWISLCNVCSGEVPEEKNKDVLEEQCFKLSHGTFINNSSKKPYCLHASDKKEIHRLFATVFVHVKSKSNTFHVLESDSVEQLKADIKNRVWYSLRSFISPRIVYVNFTTLSSSPFHSLFFEVSFYGDDLNHTVTVREIWIDRQLVLRFLTGIVIFFAAKTLCSYLYCISREDGQALYIYNRHMLFIYLSGVSLGIFMSWLVLLLLLVKLLPAKKGLVSSVLLIGTNLGLYIAQSFFNNFMNIILCHKKLVAGYFTVVGCLTFAAMYYFDPGRNIRFLNLVQWTIQIIGCSLVFWGTRIQEVSVTVVVIMISVYVTTEYISFSSTVGKFIWYCIPYRIRYRIFKPKFRFLTMEEFNEVGAKETREALEHLRNYCNSPDCDSWKIVSRLKDPKRFAQFMESGIDISNEEMHCHEQWDDSRSHDWLTSEDDETIDNQNAEDSLLSDDSMGSTTK